MHGRTHGNLRKYATKSYKTRIEIDPVERSE
jgi:hypothetical protein